MAAPRGRPTSGSRSPRDAASGPPSPRLRRRSPASPDSATDLACSRIYDAGAAGGRLSTACGAVRSEDGTGDLGVDADRVAPKIQGKLFRRSVDLDRFRSAVRHVAVDAGGRESLSDLGGHRMLARLMTRQALLDKGCHVALRTMDVVARRARHAPARAKTFSALQQRHLIPVDVGGRRRVRGRGEIILQLVTRSVGERRNFWVPPAGVAQGTVFHLPVSRETRGIERSEEHTSELQSLAYL